MCGGSPEVDTSYQDFMLEEAERARREEEERQARVDDGLAHIEAIYEGGEYIPTTSEYVQITPETNNIFNPSPGEWELVTTEGDPITYEGYDPYFAQREAAQMDFYMPQLEKELERGQEELTFALARAGLLNSTTAGERQGDLSEDYALQHGAILADIASDIAGQKTLANQNRSSIEAALRASGDASAAADAALQSAVTFQSDMPELNPLGNLFYGIAEGIGAAQTGYDVGTIKRTSTPSPLSSGSGRIVGA